MKLAIIAGDCLFIVDIPRDYGDSFDGWVLAEIERFGYSADDCVWGVVSFINGGLV